MSAVDVLAVPNPFRNKTMRRAFDDAVSMFNTRHKNLFLADGCTPHRGNSWAGMFWRGYEGTQIGVWDRASKQLPAYATWRAGKAVAIAVRNAWFDKLMADRAALARCWSAK